MLFKYHPRSQRSSPSLFPGDRQPRIQHSFARGGGGPPPQITCCVTCVILKSPNTKCQRNQAVQHDRACPCVSGGDASDVNNLPTAPPPPVFKYGRSYADCTHTHTPVFFRPSGKTAPPPAPTIANCWIRGWGYKKLTRS